MSVLSYASTCVFLTVHVTSVCVYEEVSRMAIRDTLINSLLLVIACFLMMCCLFKFHQHSFRACRCVQDTLQKISPSCLRRLIAESESYELLLPL
jgi:hypothetical protein